MKDFFASTTGSISTGATVKGVNMAAFKLRSVLDFYEDFDKDQCALKALAELIGSSDSDLFSNADGIYRYGLQTLLETFLEKQEAQFKALRGAIVHSPEFIIERAKTIKNGIDNGIYPNPATSSDVRESLAEIEALLALFGEEEYPEAQIIREKFKSKRIDKISSLIDKTLYADDTHGQAQSEHA